LAFRLPTWEEIAALPWGWIGLGLAGGVGLAIAGLSVKKGLGIDPPPEVAWPDHGLVERKKAEWTAKGYPPGLQEKAIKWAQGWAAGLTRRVGLPDEYAAKIYPHALDLADEWLRGIWGFFE
jgi:hypothetical protein